MQEIDLTGELIRIQTQRCAQCGEKGVITMPRTNWDIGIAIYENGELIQNAFPFLSPEEREMLITGTHPECWTAMFNTNES
jgi:hypothetical protein